MRDIVTHPGQAPYESLDLVQHAIDEDRELVERILRAMRRQPLAQLAGNDALDLRVDLFYPPLCAKA